MLEGGAESGPKSAAGAEQEGGGGAPVAVCGELARQTGPSRDSVSGGVCLAGRRPTALGTEGTSKNPAIS